MLFLIGRAVLVSSAPCCSGMAAAVASSTAAVVVAVSTSSSWLFGVGSGSTLLAAHSADFLNCLMVHILWLIGRDLLEGSCLSSMWRWARVLFHERALSREGCFGHSNQFSMNALSDHNPGFLLAPVDATESLSLAARQN